MAKKDVYKGYDDLMFKRTDGNTYSSNNQTNNRRARSQYLADQQASRDAAAKSLAAQNEVNAYDALQQAAYGAWAAQNQPKQTTPTNYTGGTAPAAQTDDGVDWSLYPNGRPGVAYFDFSDVPAGTNPTGFSYGKAPSYIDPYQQQIAQLQNTILNRGPFSYDPNTDPLYAQYAKEYDDAGRRAMQNTLAQVSARTGGLASSYAGSAAQQAYNNYMARLADKVPELQQLAYQMYQDEQTRDMANLNMLRALSGDDYGRYQDTLAQFNTDRDYDTGLWRYGVEDARYNAEDALNRAAIGASLGDYSGYNALGYDTSAKTAPRYSYSGGGSGSSADKATGKPTLTEAAVRANIKAGNITNDVLAAYEYYYGEPYEDSIPFFRNDTEARKWLLENDVYTGAVKGNQDLMDRREFEHRKHSGGVNDVTKGYDDYEDYINDYARYIYETRRAK